MHQLTTNHYFAKLLQPKYNGAKLSYQQIDKAKQWIVELLPSFMNFNAGRWSFTISTAILCTTSLQISSSKLVEEPEESATSKIQNLADVMIHVLSRPASSASVEWVGPNILDKKTFYKKNFLSSIFGRTDLHEAEKRLGMDHAAELVNRTLCGCSAEDDYRPWLTQWILTN